MEQLANKATQRIPVPRSAFHLHSSLVWMLDTNMKPLIYLFGPLLLALVIVTGCSRERDDADGQIFTDFQADALAARILLTELRAGRATNAIELLEQQIDSSVIVIDGSLSRVTGLEHAMALETLQSLKAYREAHPRRQEAVIPDTESLVDYTADMRSKASIILSKIE